jgi:hypothetical protein
MPDTQRPMRIECDASDYAWGAILSTQMDDGLWHPTAYLSKSMTDAERNYDIHDKELRAIIGSLEAWRHYLEGCKYTIDIWTDHKNLEYFQKAQKLSRRQARWAQFLTRFDFTLTHKPGKHNKADELSRRRDHKQGIENDNADQVVLPGKLFSNRVVTSDKALFPNNIFRRGYGHSEDPEIAKKIRATTAVIEERTSLHEDIQKAYQEESNIAEVIRQAKDNGPRSIKKGIQDWNFEDGLLLYRGRIYVPKQQWLRKEVVKSCHDPKAMGHPGQYQTIEIVQRNYW